MYRLTQKAIRAVNQARPEILRLLMAALDCSENTVNRHIRENETNGELTKKASLDVIREATGLTEGEIILQVFQEEDIKDNTYITQ